MRKYDDEYKHAAVKKIHDGQSVASVSRELGVAESLLHNWKRQVTEAVPMPIEKRSPSSDASVNWRWNATF